MRVRDSRLLEAFSEAHIYSFMQFRAGRANWSRLEAAFLCVLTSLTFAALGLLVASGANAMEAVSGLMNPVMLPMWILSGVFFSASRFPAIVQPFVRALPLTAAIDAMRGNMLQGTNLAHLLTPVAILLAWLVLPFALSLRIFRWR